MILYSTFLVAPSVKQNLSTIIWGKSMPIGDLHNNVFSRQTHFFQFEFCFRNSVGSRSKIPFFSLWFACLVVPALLLSFHFYAFEKYNKNTDSRNKQNESSSEILIFFFFSMIWSNSVSLYCTETWVSKRTVLSEMVQRVFVGNIECATVNFINFFGSILKPHKTPCPPSPIFCLIIFIDSPTVQLMQFS